MALPEPDVDEKPLLAALSAAGIDARLAGWDDPTHDWSAPVPTVIRSTWNYYLDHAAFLAWAERAAAAAPLMNPLAVIRDNTHKGYLARLAAAGLSVVPTLHIARGAHTDLARTGWTQLVVKPAVSAGSYLTRRFAAGDLPAAQAFADELAGARDVLVQPYVDSVDSTGERSLIWIDGEFTHAMRKSPRFLGQDESVTGPHPIADDERALAQAALAGHADLLYARVDMARDAAGRPMIMEVELTEPSLFFVQHPPALARLVSALQRRLAR